VIDACGSSSLPEAEWVCRLANRYPEQPSMAATLLLNYVVLSPGQALRLDAGNLHSYLHGAGIELMGPSDNVVRGGLTDKPVDVELLLEIVDTTPLEQPVLDVAERYDLPAAGVSLLLLEQGQEHVAKGHELAVDLAGAAWYYAPGERIVTETATYVVTPF
jgi:mannose-6-phosphate isomerase